MADATAAFAVTLEDHVSAGAKKASASIGQISSSLKGAKSELSNFEAHLSTMKDFGGGGIASSLGGITGTLGKIASGWGLVAVAAGAATAAVAGFVTVTESLIEFTLKAANENEHQIAVFEALGMAGEGSGKKTLAMLDAVGAKLPQSEEQLVRWTKQIQAMGVADLSQVRSELVATASAQAIMGDEGAAAYQKLQQRVRLAVEAHHGLKLAEKSLTALYKAGVNQADIAAKMGLTTEQLGAKLKAGTVDAKQFGDALRSTVTTKGRGALDVQMNSLDAMSHKLKKSIGDLFEETDTKPLTDALRNLLALFEDGTPSADGMKMGIVGAMNAIIRVVAKGITQAEIFFLDIEIGALRAYIALKPIISAVSSIVSGMSAIGGAVGGLVSKGGAAVGGATGLDPAAAQGAGDRIGQQALFGLAGPLGQMANMVGMMAGDFANEKALAVARQSGVQIGQATIDGVREGTQTHSPSLEAIRIGMGIGEGLGQGMESSPAPERASRTISANALGGIKGGAAGIGGGAAPANTNAVGPIHIAITAPEGVTDAHALSVIGLSTALERFMIGSGR